MQLRIYLIRHGETDYNRMRVIQGHTELPLNDLGIAQATRLARRMRDYPMDLIYASDVRRAAMTAAILASHTGASIVWEPLLRERNPGDLVHRSYDEAARFFLDPAYIPADGEGCEAFDRRVGEAFQGIVQRETSPRNGGNGGGAPAVRNVAVVTHGMVCASFLRHVVGYGEQDLKSVRWRNTSLSILNYSDGWRVETLSDASHLEGLDDGASNPPITDGQNLTVSA